MKHDILFMNDKLVNELAGNDMKGVIHDVERALSLLDSGEALNPEKAVMKWGKTGDGSTPWGLIWVESIRWQESNGSEAVP